MPSEATAHIQVLAIRRSELRPLTVISTLLRHQPRTLILLYSVSTLLDTNKIGHYSLWQPESRTSQKESLSQHLGTKESRDRPFAPKVVYPRT
jgi:hypothetical protein